VAVQGEIRAVADDHHVPIAVAVPAGIRHGARSGSVHRLADAHRGREVHAFVPAQREALHPGVPALQWAADGQRAPADVRVAAPQVVRPGDHPPAARPGAPGRRGQQVHPLGLAAGDAYAAHPCHEHRSRRGSVQVVVVRVDNGIGIDAVAFGQIADGDVLVHFVEDAVLGRNVDRVAGAQRVDLAVFVRPDQGVEVVQVELAGDALQRIALLDSVLHHRGA